jgi:hypothetical protein
MKYVLLAILATFSLSVTAATTIKGSKSNSSDRTTTVKGSKSNSDNRDIPTKEQCAATKDAELVAQCKQLGIAIGDPIPPAPAATTVKSSVKSAKSNASERGKPTKEQIEQCAASKDAKFKQVCTQQGIAVTDEGVPSTKQKPIK